MCHVDDFLCVIGIFGSLFEEVTMHHFIVHIPVTKPERQEYNATCPLSRCYLRYITMWNSNLVQESNAKHKNSLGMIKTTPRAIPTKTRVENEYNKRTKSITRCHNVSQHRDHIASNIVKVGGVA